MTTTKLTTDQLAQNLWTREGGHCVSHLVSTLASADDSNGFCGFGRNAALPELCGQAYELSCPIDDWEEAARQAGWKPQPLRESLYWDHLYDGRANIKREDYPEWEDLCRHLDIEPYQREIFEHWIVSDWLADKLAEQGEKVDKDFAGLTIWARTTTGQAVYADHVIEQIAKALQS